MDKLYEYCYENRIQIVIPEGFHFEKGKVEDGLVIQNSENDSFVRIPSGYTADGLYVKGFWVSSYIISKDDEGSARSVSNQSPWNLSYYEAKDVAERFGGDLISKDEYNRICMWIVQTHAATFEQVFIDGTGVTQAVNNIDSFWSSYFIWTTQRSELYEHYKIVRGGVKKIYGTGILSPPSSKAWAVPEKNNHNIGFRIVLHDA